MNLKCHVHKCLMITPLHYQINIRQKRMCQSVACQTFLISQQDSPEHFCFIPSSSTWCDAERFAFADIVYFMFTLKMFLFKVVYNNQLSWTAFSNDDERDHQHCEWLKQTLSETKWQKINLILKNNSSGNIQSPIQKVLLTVGYCSFSYLN